MALITSQKITDFYERFKTIEVTFSKEIIEVTRLITAQVYLKCGGDFWPCVVYSTSFQGAKVVANIRSGLVQKLQTTNNSISLRLCFKKPDVDAPVTFFVSGRISGYSPYGGSQDIALFSIQFTQRPPDDLIEIMGRVLDANVNSAKRREERLLLSPELIRKIGLMAKETAIFIQGVPRRCILRDISFSGTKIIMMGIAKFLSDREVAVRLDFEDPRESYSIKGNIIRTEEVEGRKELVALAVQFVDGAIPMGYKVRLNEYLGYTKVESRPDYADTKEASKPEPAPKPTAAAPKPTTAAPAAKATTAKAPAAAVPETPSLPEFPDEPFTMPEMEIPFR
ncbi:MAG: PilZ domain-containing protein [Spirochaetaceae bacterium]|jgi:hypothetical protein|nr:PilZ domain-containing protein [Spirochaetaceae bacterium]